MAIQLNTRIFQCAEDSKIKIPESPTKDKNGQNLTKPEESSFKDLVQWIRNDNNQYDRDCVGASLVAFTTVILTIITVATLIGIIPLVYAAKEWNRQAVEIKASSGKIEIASQFESENERLRTVIRSLVQEHNEFLDSVTAVATRARTPSHRKLNTQETLLKLIKDDKGESLPLWWDGDEILNPSSREETVETSKTKPNG